jgi:hypothetical protein
LTRDEWISNVNDPGSESVSLVPALLSPMLSIQFQEFDRSGINIKACMILSPVIEFLGRQFLKLLWLWIVAKTLQSGQFANI